MTLSTSSPPARVLNVHDVADLLGISEQTVRSMARKKQLPAFKYGRNSSPYRFRPEAIQKWLEAREAAASRWH